MSDPDGMPNNNEFVLQALYDIAEMVGLIAFRSWEAIGTSEAGRITDATDAIRRQIEALQ